MASKGQIDSIIDIEKVKQQINTLNNLLDTIMVKIETISEDASKLKFEGFDKASSVKEVAMATSQLSTILKSAKDIEEEQVKIIQQKSALENKLILAQTQEAKAVTTLKMQINEKNKEVQNEIKMASAQAGSLEQMRLKLALLTKEYDKANAGKRNELIPEIQKLTADITEAEQAVGNFKRQVGNYEIAGKSMKSELKAMTEELAKMKIAGLSGTPAFEELREKAGEFKDAMIDATAEINNFASDTHKLDNLISVAEGLAGSFGVVQGTMAALGIEDENLQEQFVRLQGVMTVLNSLKAISNTLEKESGAYTLATNIQRRIQVLLTYAQTKAETGGIVTRKLATAAQWALNKAMLANPAGLLLVTLGALISIGYALYKITTSNETKQRDLSRALDATKNSIKWLHDETERTVKIMEAFGASQYDITLKLLNTEKEAYNKRETIIKNFTDNYKDLSKEQEEELKKQIEEQEAAGSKIVSLQTDLRIASVKELKATQKNRIEAMKDGYAKQNALLEYSYEEEIRTAGANEELKKSIVEKYNRQRIEIQKQASKKAIAIERRIIESNISLMQDGIDKERAIIKEKYNNEIADLKMNGEATTALILSIERQRDHEIAEKEKEFEDKRKDELLKFEQEKLTMQLEIIEEGTASYLSKKIEIINKEREISIREAIKTKQDISVINAAFNKKIAEETYNITIKNLDEESKKRINFRDKIMLSELRALSNLYAEGKITLEQYEAGKAEIENKYNRKTLEEAIDTAQKNLDILKKQGINITSAEASLNAARKALYDADALAFEKAAEKKKEVQEQLKNKLIELGQQTFDAITSIINSSYDAKFMKIDEEAKKDEEAKNAELNRVGNNETLKEGINRKYAEKEKQREKERRKLDAEKAQFEKTAALFQIVIETTKALAQVKMQAAILAANPLTAALVPIALAQIPIILATSALQAAAISAKPIPKYFKGRKGGKAELAIVGEQGSEIIQQKSGELFLTPSRPTLTFLHEGASVIPHEKVFEMYKNLGFKDFPKHDTLNSLHIKQLSTDINKLENGFKQVVDAVNNRPENITNISEKGIQKIYRDGKSWHEYIDNNIRIK